MANQKDMKISTGKKFLYAIIILLACFILLEAVLRMAGIHSRRESPFFLLLKVHEYPEYFQRHSTLFWEFIPNKTISGDFIAEGEYQINSNGFRGKEFIAGKPDSTIRICCIGNSCTFGWEIAEGKTYSDILRGQLKSRFPTQKFEVINCGVPGYTSHQGLTLLKEKILDFDPDIITLSFGWNDIWGAGKGITDNEQKILSPLVIWMQNNLAKLETYRLIKYLLLEVTEEKGLEGFDMENPSYRVSLEEYKQNLSEIHQVAESNGIIPIFLTSPAPDAKAYFGGGVHTQLSELFRIHEEYNEVIRTLRDKEQFWVVPLASHFANRSDYFDPELKDYIHYNQEGHKQVAIIISRFITRYQILDKLMADNNITN
jgi:lysophospholipase L1-like esterase